MLMNPLARACQNMHNIGDEPTISEYQTCFLGSSYVTSTRKLLVIFLVNKEIIPIKIEKLLGI